MTSTTHTRLRVRHRFNHARRLGSCHAAPGDAATSAAQQAGRPPGDRRDLVAGTLDDGSSTSTPTRRRLRHSAMLRQRGRLRRIPACTEWRELGRLSPSNNHKGLNTSWPACPAHRAGGRARHGGRAGGPQLVGLGHRPTAGEHPSATQPAQANPPPVPSGWWRSRRLRPARRRARAWCSSPRRPPGGGRRLRHGAQLTLCADELPRGGDQHPDHRDRGVDEQAVHRHRGKCDGINDAWRRFQARRRPGLDTVTIDSDTVNTGDRKTAVGNLAGPAIRLAATGQGKVDRRAAITVQNETSASQIETLTNAYETSTVRCLADSGGPDVRCRERGDGHHHRRRDSRRSLRTGRGRARCRAGVIRIARAMSIVKQIESGQPGHGAGGTQGLPGVTVQASAVGHDHLAVVVSTRAGRSGRVERRPW